MKRDPERLASRRYDLLVVGGGVYGTAIAWDAALRGFSVALLDKGDFGSRTSSNSLRIVHGGLRYLQQADWGRMRASIAERRNLMRIAPHLVHPLPCVMPTYKRFLRRKSVMSAALKINDLVGFDRNDRVGADKHIPAGEILSKEECLRLLPGVHRDGLTGAALWHDGRMQNSERLTLAFALSAAEAGADLANYVEVKGFLRHGNQVTGVQARDGFSGKSLQIRSRLVVNACGPWVNQVAGRTFVSMSKAMNVWVRRPLVRTHAAGVYHPEGPVFFLVPWREGTLVGTAHRPYQGDPETVRASEEEIREFLRDVNRAYPGASLAREDVLGVFVGLIPAHETPSGSEAVRLLRNPRLVDHEREDGIAGLLSVVGVKYTTARRVAEEAVDLAARKLNRVSPPCRTASTPLQGGETSSFTDYLNAQMENGWRGVPRGTIRRLILTYGTEYRAVLRLASGAEFLAHPLTSSTDVRVAEVLHAVREEMAQKLTDVVLRRTELGQMGFPGEENLGACAQWMARELAWDGTRTQEELEECRAVFDPQALVPA